MSVQMFSDHSDFYKARRALIASAVTLILLQDIELVENTLTILGLKFIISFEKISFYVMLVTLYFSYVFLLRSVGHRARIFNSIDIESIEEQAKVVSDTRSMLREFEQKGESLNYYLVEEKFYQMEKIRDSILNRGANDWRIFILIEIIPVWLITVISLSLYFSLHKISLPSFN